VVHRHLGAVGVEDPLDARRPSAQIGIGLAHGLNMFLNFPFDVAAETVAVPFRSSSSNLPGNRHPSNGPSRMRQPAKVGKSYGATSANRLLGEPHRIREFRLLQSASKVKCLGRGYGSC
jgi:hypothetical protein